MDSKQQQKHLDNVINHVHMYVLCYKVPRVRGVVEETGIPVKHNRANHASKCIRTLTLNSVCVWGGGGGGDQGGEYKMVELIWPTRPS